MTIQLSSLRVSLDLDSSGYVQGAQAKVNADQAMAQSGRSVGAALAQQDSAAGNSGGILGRLQRQYVDGYGAATRFQSAINLLQKGVESGNVPLDRAGLILQGLHAKYGLMADASAIAAKGNADLAAVVQRTNAQIAQITPNVDAARKAHSGLSAEAQAAGHSMRSFVDSVISGQSPTTALAQQIGNLQFAASGRNGLSGALKEVTGTLGGLITPARAAGVALAAAAGVALVAWNKFDDAQKETLRTLQGMGRGLGETAAGFEAMAQRMATAGQLSISTARDLANELARTGNGINTQSIERLASVSKDFSATFTSGSLEAGLKKITELVSSGAEGIAAWGKQQNIYNAAQLRTVNDAVRHHDINQAISVTLDALNGKMASWRDTTGTLAKAWDEIKKSLSDIMTAFGPFVDKMASAASGFLQAAARGAQNIANGDFSHNPISQAVQGRDLSGFATAAGGGEPNAAEKYQQLAARTNEAAKATDNLAAAQAKVQPQLAGTGAEVTKLDDDLRSAQQQLRDQLNESFNIGDRTAIQEKLVKVREALEGTSEAAKKSAVSFAQSDNAQISAAVAADQHAAATNRANTEANRLSTIAQENTDKIVGEAKAYDEAKATLDLFADAKRQGVELTRDQIEAEDRARHVVESQKNAEGERMTQAEQAAKVRENEITTIKARTLAQEQSAKEDEVENRNRGRSIEGLQNEAEKRHASTVVLTQWQEQQERTNRGIQDNIAVMELQKNGLFANDQERAVAVARMQAELEMVERLGPGWRNYAQAVQYVDLKAAAAKSSAELQKQDQLWSSLQSTASSALGSLAKDLASERQAR
jgi:hypothetical protein